MRTSGQILIPTVSYGNYWNASAAANNNPSYNPGYPNYNANTANNWAGDPVKAASYYRSPGGLQTVAYYCTNFVGNLIFEGTLESDPDTSVLDPLASNYPWFKIAEVSGLGQNAFLQTIPNVPAYRISSELFNSGVAFAAQSNTTVANAYQGSPYVASASQVKFNLLNAIPGVTIGSQMDVIATNANNASFTGRTTVINVAGANVILQYDHDLSTYVNSPNVTTTVYWPINTNPYGATQIFQLNGTYPADQLIVSVNGVVQAPGSSAVGGAYTVIGSTLSFNEPLLANSLVEVREFYEPFATTNFNSESFLANGQASTFTLLNTQASYSTNSVVVSVNGLVQAPLQRSTEAIAAGNVLPLTGIIRVPDTSSVTGNVLTFSFIESPNFMQLPPLGSTVGVYPGNAITQQNYLADTAVSNGAVIQNIVSNVDTGGIETMTLLFPRTPNSATWLGQADVVFPNFGSYILRSTANANINGYINQVIFDWTPEENDLIEVREIVGGNIPIPAFTGVSALNLLGNFTWIRCRVRNFSGGVINKVTISY